LLVFGLAPRILKFEQRIAMSAQPYSPSDRNSQQEQRGRQEPPPEEPSQADAMPGQSFGDRAVWLRRAVLVLIAALAGLSYGWASSQDTLEYYYAAAVRSMSVSWHDFLFGAVDPAGTISLDKLPGAFWIQALAVRAFGLHTWVIIAPQVAEGVLTVLILYRAVSRLAGPAAGLIGALVVAGSPATVALNRGNISDSLMILLLVLAVDSVSAAIAAKSGPAKGAQARLILAAFWVGLAFQAKMIEAWLVLPALGLAYLLDGPGPVARRVRQLVVAGVVTGIVSLAWMTAVSLVPASHRPYADGSSNDSVYAQVFVYNGFGRFGDQTPVQLLESQFAPQLAPDLTLPVGPPSAGRLFTGDLGRDTGWLLPAAFLAAIWGIAGRWRRPRGDGPRACFVLWGAWLLTLAVTFSVTTTVQTYYAAALTPAIAAILAAAAVSLFAPGTRRAGGAAARRIGLAVVSAGTTAYAVWLVPAHGAHVPGWLVPAIIAAGAAAVVVIIGSALVERAALATAAMAAALAAALAAPAVASVGLTANHESFSDTPFESPRLASQIASASAAGRAAASHDPSPEDPARQCPRPDGHADLSPRVRVHLHQRRGDAPDRRVHRNHPVAHPEPAQGRHPRRAVPPGPGSVHHRPAPPVDRHPLPRHEQPYLLLRARGRALASAGSATGQTG
jgi:4-amino-4-deoxy-L-arabinose transferase-like glycosyltransferase